MITGGTITFEQRVKTGEFEHKVAKAEISFSIPEGAGPLEAEAQAEAASNLAQAEVLRLVGMTGRPTKRAETPAKAPAAKPPTPAATKPVEDGFDTVTEQPKATEPAKAAEPAADEFASEPATPVISDVELTAAAQAKSKELQSPARIRELIGKYVAQDGLKHQLVEIPQEKRGAFVKELAALKAA